MAITYAQYINYEMNWLVNYINHIVDFNNSYNDAIKNLYSKNNLDYIAKSQDMTSYENEMKKSYDKAMELYRELCCIADKYKNGSDVKDDIKYFNNKLNNTEFKIYEKATISLKSAINVPEILSEDVYTDCGSSVCKGSIYENNVDIEKENFENEVQKWENRIKLNKIPFLSKIAGTLYQWGNPDAVGMINIASGKYLPIYTKDAIKIKNISDKNFEKFNKGDLLKWQLCMADKISEQFSDYNYDLGDIKGYIFKKNSAVVKRIKKSEEFKNILSKHISYIKSKNKFSDKYVTDENLHSAFGSVDFFIGGLDKNGNLHLYMFDTYDFNKNETSPAVEAGRRQMLNGNLKGFFSIHEIVITKKELEKYGLQDIS